MAAVEASFLGSGAARRLAVCWRPPADVAPIGAALFVPPFAEEMNKSRRMVALTAAALAGRGMLVLRIDLAGCGDSAGRLAQVGWDDWLDDLVAARRWLAAATDVSPWLWSLRAGALLAQAARPRLGAVAGQLLWQPVLSGKQHLTQFLRLRVAADAFALADAGARATTASLTGALHAGEPVDVAGYRLPPTIALPLAAAELMPPPDRDQTHWLEVGQDDMLAPASAARIAQWQAAGQRITARAVAGPPFWTTQEIEDSPALVAATVEALCPPL
ncbi:MAG: hydrolase 2, exosortase A system-associated [Burkholderiaceae bacterium]|nr:hydrolase 2, exosortase A system-associated [Burkholderiaceae bacterium]